MSRDNCIAVYALFRFNHCIQSDIYFGNPDSDWSAEWLGGRCLAYLQT
jgi:hypothetical protein